MSVDCNSACLCQHESASPVTRFTGGNRSGAAKPYVNNFISIKSFGIGYISASPITLEQPPKTYIATQGPLKSSGPRNDTGVAAYGTMVHFWEMCFRENVEVIVMLTQFKESGKKMCAPYFPLSSGIYDGFRWMVPSSLY